jgi:hypothetical protein
MDAEPLGERLAPAEFDLLTALSRSDIAPNSEGHKQRLDALVGRRLAVWVLVSQQPGGGRPVECCRITIAGTALIEQQKRRPE